MKRRGIRVGLLILVSVGVCGFALINLKDTYWPDDSLAGRLRQLGSKWVSQRRAAAADLARFNPDSEKAVPALYKALEDPDLEVRRNVLVSLDSFGEKSRPAGPALRQRLKQDPDPKIRRDAMALLGRLKDKESLPILIETLDDNDLATRAEAIRSLGRFGPSIASKPLIEKVLSFLHEGQPEELRAASLDTLDSLARGDERIARVTADAAAKDPSGAVRKKAVNLLVPKFDFVVPTLVAALDDPEPQVRLAAGDKLAWIGMSDDRTVPALCHAALKADDVTREGIGIVFSQLILDRSDDQTPRDLLDRRFQTAVRELRKVVETRDAAARVDVVDVLGRIIASYEKSRKPGLLEPARAALDTLLARIDDKGEEIPLRLHAMDQWSLVQMLVQTKPYYSRGEASGPGGEARKDELHATAVWIATLGKMLKDPDSAVRARAVEILVDSFKDPLADAPFRETWRKLVPALAEATRSDDALVRSGALTILTLLGPEAGQALASLRSLAHDTQDSAVRTAAEAAIKSMASLDDLKSKDPAARIAACEELGRIGWRATPALPALIGALKDSEAKVRLAAVSALHALGSADGATVTSLATRLTAETDASVRVAILDALEAIAPGSRPVLDAHLSALHDQDPQVRKAAASFRKVPAEDSVVAALAAALGDPSDQVRLAAAHSLSEIMFENATVIPTLVKALGNSAQREESLKALDEHLEKVSDRSEFGRVRSNLPGLRSTLDQAISALKQALNFKNDEVRTRVFGLLGRIAGFSSLSRDADLQKSIEPALRPFLGGLDDGNPEIRQAVLGRLDSIAVCRADVVAALLKDLQRPDQSDEDHQKAVAALAAQAAFADSDSALRDVLRPALPLLVKGLDSAQTEIRRAAIQALGHMEGEAKSAEEVLRRLAGSDPQAEIRRDAEIAVKAIQGVAKMPPARRPAPPSPLTHLPAE